MNNITTEPLLNILESNSDSTSANFEIHKQLLLLPYIFLTLILLLLVAASFAHFHVKNRARYSSKYQQKRAVQKQSYKKCRVTMSRFVFLSRPLTAKISNHVQYAHEPGIASDKRTISKVYTEHGPGKSGSRIKRDIIPAQYEGLDLEYCDSEQSLLSDNVDAATPASTTSVRYGSPIGNFFSNSAYISYQSLDRDRIHRPQTLDLSVLELVKMKEGKDNFLPGTKTGKTRRNLKRESPSETSFTPVNSPEDSVYKPSMQSEFRRSNREKPAGMNGSRSYGIPGDIMYIQV